MPGNTLGPIREIQRLLVIFTSLKVLVPASTLKLSALCTNMSWGDSESVEEVVEVVAYATMENITTARRNA
jgi:hypothetical protein